jgi:purine nucleosidase
MAASERAVRRVPVIPPPGQTLRVVIDSDCATEIGDQWAIALAILCPERLTIEGFVSANYLSSGGPDGVEKSAQEIERVLAAAGMAGRWPVKRGSQPMQFHKVPSPSEGVDFIIEQAMAGDAASPLWIIGLGQASTTASAYVKEPRIADRVVSFHHFRTRWPEKAYNYNVFGDVRAAQVIFHSDLPFVLFDTGTYLTCSMEESAREVAPYGDLGKYLHEYRYKNVGFQSIKKGFFDMGDIAALVDPSLAAWEETACPEVDHDLDYVFNNKHGSILRCYHVDRDRSFGLLYSKLRQYRG